METSDYVTIWQQIFGTAQHARIDNEWTMSFRVLYYLANTLNALPFFTVVAICWWLYLRRHDLVIADKPGMIWVAFFTLHGVIVASNILAVEWPAMGLFLLLRGISALTGLLAMISLWWLVPALLNAPNRIHELEIEKAKAERQARYERKLKEKAHELIDNLKKAQDHETLEAKLKLQESIDDLTELSERGVRD